MPALDHLLYPMSYELQRVWGVSEEHKRQVSFTFIYMSFEFIVQKEIENESECEHLGKS